MSDQHLAGGQVQDWRLGVMVVTHQQLNHTALLQVMVSLHHHTSHHACIAGGWHEAARGTAQLLSIPSFSPFTHTRSPLQAWNPPAGVRQIFCWLPVEQDRVWPYCFQQKCRYKQENGQTNNPAGKGKNYVRRRRHKRWLKNEERFQGRQQRHERAVGVQAKAQARFAIGCAQAVRDREAYNMKVGPGINPEYLKHDGHGP
jgi:hypothetical protein